MPHLNAASTTLGRRQPRLLRIDTIADVPLAGEPQQRRPIRPHAELPRYRRRRHAVCPHRPGVNPVEMMRGADSDAIVAGIVAAA